MRHRWSWHWREPGDFRARVLYGDREAALVDWTCRLRHPNLAMDRIVRALTFDISVPPRTWSCRNFTDSPLHVELLHNGLPAGAVRWNGRLRDPDRWNRRVVNGLNLQRTASDPFPEPLQPASAPTSSGWVAGEFDVNEPSKV